MKTTAAVLLGSLASSAALTLTKEEASSAALKMQQQTHELAEHLKHPLQHDAKLAAAVKTLSGQPLTSTLNARVISKTRKSRRFLRGKKGKGKGKGKDDDEGESEVVSAPRTGLQYQIGWCAGTFLVDQTLTEPHYLTSIQFWNDVCVNGVDLTDNTPFSYMSDFLINESGDLVFSHSVYMLHDCVEENMLDSVIEDTTELTYGGNVSPNGVCTDVGGFGARIAVSETPLVHTAGGGVMVEGMDTSVNDCYHVQTSADYTSADYVEYTSNDIPFSGGYFTQCHEQDNSDDTAYDDDDNDDLVPIGGSYMFDLSRCGEDPPKRVMNIFTTNDCSGTPTVHIEDSDMCEFDGRDTEDLFYLFENCWSGA
jgi:hypothetical protein